MWSSKLALAAASLLSLALCCGTASAARFFIDFSRTDANGGITVSPDANGNYWNNLASNGFDVPVGLSLTDLIDTDSNSSTIDVETIAVADATRDYFFVEGSQNSSNPNDPSGLIFSDLDPNATYDFRFFGTRVTSALRESRHTIIGGNKTEFATLVTSGTDVGSGGYDGNNDTLVEITGVTPDANNEIMYLLSVVQGNYAYISAMEVNQRQNVPEPSSALLLGGCALAAVGCWRRARYTR